MRDELGKPFIIYRALGGESPTRGRLVPDGWVPGLGLQLPGSLPSLAICMVASAPPPPASLPGKKLLGSSYFIRIFQMPPQPDPSLLFYFSQDSWLQVTEITSTRREN